MAHLKKVPVVGTLKINPDNYSPFSRLLASLHSPKDVSRSELLEEAINRVFHCNIKYNESYNAVDYLCSRELGNHKLHQATMSKEYGTTHLLKNNVLKENEIKLDRINKMGNQYVNKVFCAKWLSDQQIAFGTKCNRLMVLNLNTRQVVQIPSLKSSPQSVPPEVTSGIHGLEINPSRTLLATGAYNPNDVAIYRLPTLDPVCVGEGAHKDWIFDITWLDDEFLVTGSRDTTLALWRVKDSEATLVSQQAFPSHSYMNPLRVKNCHSADKVRALIFNERYSEIAALSLNAYLHLWDAQTFTQKVSQRLTYCMDNVCLAQNQDSSMYAVGSKSHITLLDPRCLNNAIFSIASKYHGCNIRSLSFSGDILTIGTGIGVLLFYDVRARGYLEVAENRGRAVVLKATRGWVYPDETYREAFLNIEYNPAIYTHCFDLSGVRLFTAGGPLPASLQGNYAGLWQ